MGDIYIKCPKTGVEVRTGWGGTKESFARSNYTNCQSRCTECGQPHTWSKKDAIFRESPPNLATKH